MVRKGLCSAPAARCNVSATAQEGLIVADVRDVLIVGGGIAGPGRHHAGQSSSGGGRTARPIAGSLAVAFCDRILRRGSTPR
jgi:hypothetical protein